MTARDGNCLTAASQTDAAKAHDGQFGTAARRISSLRPF